MSFVERPQRRPFDDAGSPKRRPGRPLDCIRMCDMVVYTVESLPRLSALRAVSQVGVAFDRAVAKALREDSPACDGKAMSTERRARARLARSGVRQSVVVDRADRMPVTGSDLCARRGAARWVQIADGRDTVSRIIVVGIVYSLIQRSRPRLIGIACVAV
jgi:hypothetical protein